MVDFIILDIYETDEPDEVIVKYRTTADDDKPEIAEEVVFVGDTPKANIEAWAWEKKAFREELNARAKAKKAEKAKKEKKEPISSGLMDLVQTNYT